MAPRARLTEHAIADADALALEDIAGLDHARVGDDLEPVHRGDRSRRLLSAVKRRGDHARDVASGQCLRGAVGHGAAALGEVIVRKAAIEHALGVVHLAVTQHVHDGAVAGAAHRDAQVALRRAAARRRLGRHEDSPASSAARRSSSP